MLLSFDMPATVKKYPFYLKMTIVLAGLILTVYILRVLGGVLIPLAFAMLAAVLLNPVFKWVCRPSMPRALSVLITVLLGMVCFAAIFFLLWKEVAQFGEALPLFKVKVNSLTESVEYWINQQFGVTPVKQVAYVKNVLSGAQASIGSALGTVLGLLSLVLLIPTYVFMLLYYKTLILNFIYEVFAEEHYKRVAEVLSQTKAAIQSYVVGLLVEMLIVAIMNILALLLLGVKYAILIGTLGAVINLLPIVGGIISILLPVMVVTVTRDGFSTQLAVILSYLAIQFIDNHIIFPRFVSVKVQINALISLIAVFLGDALWGIPGMFLSLPLIAVVKIICDRIDELKPWGKLLGDNVPTMHIGQRWSRRRKNAVLETQTA